MKKYIFIIVIFFFCTMKVNAISASSFIVMDMDSNRILYGSNLHKKRSVASISKIMTCILAIENGDLNKEIIIGDEIKGAYGSGIYIKRGEIVTLENLLYGLMLRSGNDAATMIATYISGSEEEFVELMNNKAKELGMKNSIFVNSSGLDNSDDGNYSTAYDMAILTRYAMNNEIYQKIVSTKKYTVKTNYKTYVWHNKNKLLNYDYITGGKTGYTEKAGRTLVSTALKENMNLVVVTIRDSDDWNTHTSLYNYAFENYIAYKVLNKDNFTVIGEEYYDGSLYIKDDVYIPLKNSEKSSLTSKIKLQKLKKYQKDDKVGCIEIYSDNTLLTTENIYVDKDSDNNYNKKENFWQKLWEWIKFW